MEVKGFSNSVAANTECSGMADEQSMHRFDPIADMPGDLVALWLSFVDIPSRLGIAQFVSHAWREAIGGDMPAVWHDVCCERRLNNSQMVDVVCKSRGHIRKLRLHVIASPECLPVIQSLRDLRVLHISFIRHHPLFAAVMPSLTLLNELSVDGAACLPAGPLLDRISVDIPTLPVLHTLRCTSCGRISGLHNLPSLTTLDVQRCDTITVDAGVAWPASLRQVTIFNHRACDFRVLERIAALHHPTLLETDWSFAYFLNETFRRPGDQLAFLGGFSTLQRFTVLRDSVSPLLPTDDLIECIGAMVSLRELTLMDICMRDKHLRLLTQLTNLQNVTISGYHQLTDEGVRILCAIPNITGLSIEYWRATSFVDIRQCKQLKTLRIRQNLPRHSCLSEASLLSIVQLTQLEKLELQACFERPNNILLSLREMPRVRDLFVKDLGVDGIDARSFSALLTMSSLQTLRIDPIRKDDLPLLVDCLVQMPSLRHIYIAGCDLEPTPQIEQSLRDTLPRLENITVHDEGLPSK